MKSVEIVSLVYRSPAYARFVSEQLVRHGSAQGWDVRLRIVANDPEVEEGVLLEAPRRLQIPTDVYHDPRPGDHYLARVYRCYNWAAQTSRAGLVCFVNSDMAFSSGWLEPLLDLVDGNTVPTSRLVESGKMPSGRHAISFNMGRTPETFDQAAWDLYVEQVRLGGQSPGGLFMPVVFDREVFLKAGGYPEGNLYHDGIGTLNGKVVKSGDDHFFARLASEFGMSHVTAFDSLVYHFQEGERDS